MSPAYFDKYSDQIDVDGNDYHEETNTYPSATQTRTSTQSTGYCNFELNFT